MSEILAMRNDYRLEEWRQIVKQCRESGLSNREFCRMNGISEKTYYYRLRKLREAAVRKEVLNNDDFPEANHSTTLCKIEIGNEQKHAAEHDRICVRFHGAEIDIPADASPDTLKMIFCVLSEI